MSAGTAALVAPLARSTLFDPLTLRGLTTRNRLWLSPMCQYSAVDGVPGDWHLAHLGGRASGGFGLVFAEATAVTPEGRISVGDTGLWNGEQERAWARIVEFVHGRAVPIGIQLAHAGRKASIPVPWGATGTRAGEEIGWRALSVSTAPFPGFAAPERATAAQLDAVVTAFQRSAWRAARAGFDVVEILAGHGFLLHSFLSPLTNDRDDEYGADRELLLHRVVDAVRSALPEHVALFVRLSATDWLEGGLDAAATAVIASRLRERGVDLVDVSTGGLAPAEIPLEPRYQVPLAARIRRESGLPTAAVGLITTAEEAASTIADGEADAVFVGRAALRDPFFAHRAAHELGAASESAWQPQYLRGAWT